MIRHPKYSRVRRLAGVQALLVALAGAFGCFDGSVDLGSGVDYGSGVCKLRVLHAAQAVAGTQRYAVLSTRSGWEGRLDYLFRHRHRLVDTQYFLRLPAAAEATFVVPGQAEAFFTLSDLAPPVAMRGSVTVTEEGRHAAISFQLAVEDPPRPKLPGQYPREPRPPVVVTLDPTVVRTDLAAVAKALHSKVAEAEPRLAPWRQEVDAAAQTPGGAAPRPQAR